MFHKIACLVVLGAFCLSQAQAASSTCSQSYYLNSGGSVTNVAGGSCSASMCYNYIVESKYYASQYYYLTITGCVDVAWTPSGSSSFMVNSTQCAQNSQAMGNYTLTVTCASSWICFAGDSMVESQSRGMVPIEDIHQDEMLKAFDQETGEVVFSRFTTYGHKDGQASSQYVVVETESGASLKLSPSHMILRNGQEFVAASALRMGDRLLLADKSETQVKSLSAGVFQGAYAPLTEQGTVFVNGVAASCYADYSSQEMAHWFHPLLTKASQFVNSAIFGYKDTTELAQAFNVFGIVQSLPFIGSVFSF